MGRALLAWQLTPPNSGKRTAPATIAGAVFFVPRRRVHGSLDVRAEPGAATRAGSRPPAFPLHGRLPGRRQLPIFSKPHFTWLLHTDYMGRRFIYRPVSESTMDDARRMMERIIFRGRPGAGRIAGRGARPRRTHLGFAAGRQPLHDNSSFPTDRDAAVAAGNHTAGGSAAVEAVAAARGVDVRADLKWPNDVQVGGKKVAGVLIETEHTADRIVALVGIGLNVNLDASQHAEIAGIATSLKEATGAEFPREEVLAAVCNRSSRCTRPRWPAAASRSSSGAAAS